MRFRNPLSAVAKSLLLILSAGTIVTGCGKMADNPTDPGNPAATPFQSKSPFASTESVIVEQVNQHRAAVGLPPLKLDATISAQARKHSEDMATKVMPVSHTGYLERINAINSIEPIEVAVENVTYMYSKTDPVGMLLMTWLNNPVLKNNIEGSYDLTGIGVARGGNDEYYVTEMFAKRRQ